MFDEVSVVLPLFNEVENIEKMIQLVFDTLDRNFKKYEIIVVDDGSTDGSDIVVQKLLRRYPNVRVITFECNRGYGVALREGFKRALYRYVFYTDSDGQFDFSEIKDIFPLILKYDMIAGYRLKRNDGIDRQMASKFYNLFVFFLLGIKLRDVNCSFKLFKREILDSIDMTSKGFSIDAELLWKSTRAGFKIMEVGVTHYKRDKGSSKVRFYDSIQTIRELLEIRARELKC